MAVGTAVTRRGRRWPGRAVAMLVLGAGAASLLHGAWIPAKARAAQLLLHRAWQRATAGEVEPRPWPWADTWPVARLAAPAHGVSLVVLEGAWGSSLAFAPGHLAGSELPGGAGNSVIAGHRDTHFRFLPELEVGDELVVERPGGERRRYRVAATEIVDHRDVRHLAPEPAPRLTLITCYPFDSVVPGGPLRYVVVAEGVGAG